MRHLNYEVIEEKLITWLKDKVSSAGARGVVVGLSGGLDSSVTAVLARKAFGDNILGLIMPCFSSDQDLRDAELVAKKFAINYKIKNLDSLLKEMMKILEQDKEKAREDSLAVANIKPRLRMTVLYYYAARQNYLVLGTDNWSEFKVGYFTKYGDGGVDLAPLGRLVKTEVRKLAQHLDIPERIINRTPSAGLWEGQTDEKEMGITYEQLDRYILGDEVPADIRNKIEELKDRNLHKTQPIPFPERDYLEGES